MQDSQGQMLDLDFRVKTFNPRKALRGGTSKVNFQQVCQLLAIISLNSVLRAPRTSIGYPHEGAYAAFGGVPSLLQRGPERPKWTTGARRPYQSVRLNAVDFWTFPRALGEIDFWRQRLGLWRGTAFAVNAVRLRLGESIFFEFSFVPGMSV